MGGTTALDALKSFVAAQRPDVMVLPEAKIHSLQRRSNIYRRVLSKDYVLAYSLLPGRPLPLGPSPRQHRGKAGIVVAVARHLTAFNTLQPLHSVPRGTIQTGLDGYLCHVRLAPPAGRPLELLGTYMPTDDTEVRAQLALYICNAAARCKHDGTALLLAGDWNGTLLDTDRSTGTVHACDREHRELAATAGLVPVGGLPRKGHPPRPYTFRQHSAGTNPDGRGRWRHALTTSLWHPAPCQAAPMGSPPDGSLCGAPFALWAATATTSPT